MKVMPACLCASYVE